LARHGERTQLTGGIKEYPQQGLDSTFATVIHPLQLSLKQVGCLAIDHLRGHHITLWKHRLLLDNFWLIFLVYSFRVQDDGFADSGYFFTLTRLSRIFPLTKLLDEALVSLETAGFLQEDDHDFHHTAAVYQGVYRPA
jgi:hypothetical protein